MRFFHGGTTAMDPQRIADLIAIDDEDKERIKADISKHHRLTKPHRDNLEIVNGKLMLKVPAMFWRRKVVTTQAGALAEIVDEDSKYTPWEVGSVVLSLPGVGFWTIPPGGCCDVPT